MKIVVCGSFGDIDSFLGYVAHLVRQGHEVYPSVIHIEQSKQIIMSQHIEKRDSYSELGTVSELRATMMKKYFKKIRECDVVHIYNRKFGKEHIGLGAAMEIGYAYALGKKVEFVIKPSDGNVASMKLLIDRGEYV